MVPLPAAPNSLEGLVRELGSANTYHQSENHPDPGPTAAAVSPPVERRPEWRTTRLISSP